jgi:hypothetical protein
VQRSPDVDVRSRASVGSGNPPRLLRASEEEGDSFF